MVVPKVALGAALYPKTPLGWKLQDLRCRGNSPMGADLLFRREGGGCRVSAPIDLATQNSPGLGQDNIFQQIFHITLPSGYDLNIKA